MTQSLGSGRARIQNICYHVAAYRILFNLICDMTVFWLKKLNFDHLTPSLGSWGRGGLGANIYYHVAAFVILLKLICNMSMFWKGSILIFWPHPQDWGGIGVGAAGFAGKIVATMLLHFLFSLIWYATWSFSEKVEFWRTGHHPQGLRVGGLWAKYLLPSVCALRFSFIWYATCPCSEKSLNFDLLTPYPGSRGGGVCRQIFATKLLYLWISLICYATEKV